MKSNDYGKRLREVRKAIGVTQPAFGEAMEITREQVSNMETGNSPVLKTRMLLLAEKYPQINIDYILTGQGDPIKKDVASGGVGEKPNPNRQKTEIEYLEQLRISRNMSQGQLAGIMGIKQPAYSRIINGDNEFRDVHKQLIELKLGVPRSYFDTGDIGIISPKDDKHHLRNKRETLPSQDSPYPIPVISRLPSARDTYSQLMEEATEHESIPVLNSHKPAKVQITDRAMDGIYEYGRSIYVVPKDKTKTFKWGSVYAVKHDGDSLVRFVQKPVEEGLSEKTHITLRACEKKMDRFQDITIPREEIEFIGKPIADFGLDQFGTIEEAA